jgi:hypothetical protein
LKSSVKKPELVTLYENCLNASVVLLSGAAGETKATFDELDFGGAMEEEELTLNNQPNFDSSIHL